MWRADSRATNETREKELSDKFFKSAVDKGAQMVRHHNTLDSAHTIIRKTMKSDPIVLQIQRELVDEGKDITDTAAGESINGELGKQIERHKAELRELREEMAEALNMKGNEMRQELGDVKRDLEESIKGIEKASQTMAVNYAAEKKWVTAKIGGMEQEAEQRERERIKPASDRNPVTPTSPLQNTANAPTDDRARREQEMKKLQTRITVPIYR